MSGSTELPAQEGRKGGWNRSRDDGAGEAWSRYHCPVCSHQDRVTLTGGSDFVHCSHCDTRLEVRLAGPTSESVSVRVAVDLPGA